MSKGYGVRPQQGTETRWECYDMDTDEAVLSGVSNQAAWRDIKTDPPPKDNWILKAVPAWAADKAKVGDIVYRCSRPNYGLAWEDSQAFGEEYIAVTLRADGDYPFFTVPTSALSPLPPPPEDK